MAAPKGNKYAEGLDNSGKPPLYDAPEKLFQRINEYFESCLPEEVEDDEGNKSIKYSQPITITGLCLYCGFESRQSFYDYEKKEEFTYIIKRARLVIENGYEIGLHYKTPTGAIFALKNMGWIDKLETEHSGNLHITKDPFKQIRENAGIDNEAEEGNKDPD